MKCGIITFHRAINFGAVLQTYALNKTINRMGVDCDVIDYRCPFLEKQYAPVSLKTAIDPMRIARILLKNIQVKDNRENFEKFSNKYIKTSPKSYNTKKELEECNKDYDIFITGSDQVWSYYCAGFDKNYFLDFVSDSFKKNSYAASFGVDSIPNDKKDTYRDLLSDFNNISVREKQGANILENIVDKENTIVLDPTLLLTKEDWSTIAYNDINEGRYLLVYLMAETKSIFKFAEELARERNLEIIYINDRFYKKKNMKNFSKIKPEQWISLFINAECIVTNSFHGIAFSINFNKEFFIEYLPEPAKVNSRLEYILDLFELTDRCISDMPKSKINKKIDYQKVQQILDKERCKSLNYIKQILGI